MSDPLLARFGASGLYHVLAVDGLKVATVAGAVAALALFSGLGRLVAEAAALAAVGAYTLAVGLHPSVVRAAIAAALAGVAWLSARERDRWHALAVGAHGSPPLEPDVPPRRRLPALVRRRRVDLRRHAARRPRARGLSGATPSRAAHRRVDRVRARDGARDVVPVPSDLARGPCPRTSSASRSLPRCSSSPSATAVIAPVAPPVAAALAHVNGWGAWFVAACARFFGGLPGSSGDVRVRGSPRSPRAPSSPLPMLRSHGRDGELEARLSPLGERPAEDRARPATPA